MKNKFLISFLVLLITVGVASTAPADLEASSFMDFVQVGDTGNAADTTGYGTVDYTYDIGKYEVTNSQYAEMLNSLGASDPNGLYNTSMATHGITQSGSSGSYTYMINSGWDDKPVNFVSWRDSARFTNWLHNGRTNDPASTESGAYDTSTFGGIWGSYSDQSTHNADALYWITTEDEWYKAAFYDPTLNSGAGGYYDYAAQSDTTPVGEAAPGGSNSANYWISGFVNPAPYITDVGAYISSSSYYGTYDQSGNLQETIEEWVTPGAARLVRGGSFGQYASYMHATNRQAYTPVSESRYRGFRVATTVIPEPTSSTLLLIGAAALGLRQLRKRIGGYPIFHV